jgi:hypothetical protein
MASWKHFEEGLSYRSSGAWCRFGPRISHKRTRSSALGRKRKHEVLPPRYVANRVDRGGLLCPNHTRRLDTLGAIASEQSRVYRATINGMISTADGARLTYQLKELRCTREAMALEAENATRKAPAVPSKVNISIVSIPAGCFIDAESAERISSGELLKQAGVKTLTLDDYTRNAAIQQAEADREIDAAISAAAPAALAYEPGNGDTFGEASRAQSTPAPVPEPELSPTMRRPMAMGYTPLPRRPCPVD